jgi:hypothetical protein
MAYKQKPGRGSMPKTGRSVPPTLMSGCKSPMKQKDPKTGMTKAEAGKEIENVLAENARRVAVEALAKSDSSAVASRAMTLDKTLSKKMAARKGNEAANKRRKQENLPLVTRGQQPQSGLPGGVKFKRPDIYSRDGQLEKDPKRSTVMTYRNSR